MRQRFADTFLELATDNHWLCMIVADISPAGSMLAFREQFPDRFINVGVSEQAMIGVAAGMALEGLRPFCYTIAPFALYRPFEFIRNDLAYQQLPVTVVGIGAGLSYSTLGPTHQAVEDISIACAVPNLQVIAPCDPSETAEAVLWLVTHSHKPTYLRLGKAGEPELAGIDADPWQFGKLRYLQKSPGYICILSYGPMMKTAISVGISLGSRSHSNYVSIVNCHTLSPLDLVGLQDVIRQHTTLVVIEEGTGWLGQQLKALCAEMSVSRKVHTFCLPQEFSHSYGSHDELLREYRLTATHITERMLLLL